MLINNLDIQHKPMIELRPFQFSDKANLMAILNDKQVCRYLSSKIPFPYTESDANWRIETGSQEGVIRAIVLNDELIGCIGVCAGDFEYQHSGEIGFWLSPSCWGQGITATAVNKIVEDVFSNTEITRIFGAVFSGNTASMRVLAKCGFKAEAVLQRSIFKNGVYFDNHIFSKLKSI